MPDPSLCGNGTACPACQLRREANPWAESVPCNQCNDTGRIARATKDIIADHVKWAREHYWPQFEKRNANG